jgi:hypothetical protein
MANRPSTSPLSCHCWLRTLPLAQLSHHLGLAQKPQRALVQCAFALLGRISSHISSSGSKTAMYAQQRPVATGTCYHPRR